MRRSLRILLCAAVMLLCHAAAQATTITVSSFTVTNWQRTTAPTIRVYYDTSFTDSSGVFIQAGNPNSGVAFKVVTCSLVGTTVTCPSFTLSSTRDGLDKTSARVSFYWFQGNALISTVGEYVNLQIPASPTTTTLADLKIVNSSLPPAPSFQYYNTAQIDSLLAAKESALTFGAPFSRTNGNVTESASGVTPGSCTSCDLTVDVWGRITAKANGSGGVSSVFGRTGAVVAATNDYTWAQVNKTTSSLADITTRSASDLSSGTLPDARFPATLPVASGVNLTALNASNLGSGTIPDARFPATLPAASGANLTALNASNLSSGTVPDARFPSTLPALNGSALTNLNATNLASGTVPLARLSGITNTEISASAAIAYSKLNLSLSIVNADIDASAGIVDTKLATISTAGKVSDSALSSNVALENTLNIFTATQTITPGANTNALTVSSYSLTGANAQSVLDLAGTWNTSGTPTAIKLNLTDTASNAASLLLDLQVGSVSKFKVAKSGTMTVDSNALFGWTSRSVLASSADGIITLFNNGGTGFTRLNFGGTSSSFPTIKRNSTALNVRLADDSADAAITAAGGTFSGVLTAGSGPTTLTDSAGKVLSAALNTVAVAQGGTGATTLTGLLLGNGTSAVTALTTSAGVAGAISDETGSGALVFATSPTFVTPTLGVATATKITTTDATFSLGVPSGALIYDASSANWAITLRAGDNSANWMVNGNTALHATTDGHLQLNTGANWSQLSINGSITFDNTGQFLASANNARGATINIIGLNASDQISLAPSGTTTIVGGNLISTGTTHGSLGTPSNGSIIFCSDCTVTSGADNTCASGGTGALAVRLNGVWRCFNAQN